MQMLGTWLVEFQAIRLDGGRCFKGVHLSQVHQPRNIDAPLGWCSSCLVGALLTWLVGALLTWMVHLRQVHPLKKALRNRNKKPPDMR